MTANNARQICRHCGAFTDIAADDYSSVSAQEWHDSAECVAAEEPSVKMGGPR